MEHTTGWPPGPADAPVDSQPPPEPTGPPNEPPQDTEDPQEGLTDGTQRALSPEDEAKALELAAAGISYRRIGALLGVSHTTAWKTVQRALKTHHDERWVNLSEFVARESVRLDRLDSVWLPKALRGEANAAVIVLRTQTSRLRLAAALGLTAPARHTVKVTGTGGGTAIDDEIAELLSKIGNNPTGPSE